MPTDHSLRALREASPRNRRGFDPSSGRYDALKAEIVGSPPETRERSQRPERRRRMIGYAVGVGAIAVVAAVIGSLTLGGASPQSAYAAAHKALVATSAQRSGTMTLTVNGATLYTTRWNGSRIALKKEQSSPLVLGHVLGPNLQMRLIGGRVYVQGPDGTWTRYAKTCLMTPTRCAGLAVVGDKLGAEVVGLAAETHPNNALEILKVASNLRKTPGPVARRSTPGSSETPTSIR